MIRFGLVPDFSRSKMDDAGVDSTGGNHKTIIAIHHSHTLAQRDINCRHVFSRFDWGSKRCYYYKQVDYYYTFKCAHGVDRTVLSRAVDLQHLHSLGLQAQLLIHWSVKGPFKLVCRVREAHLAPQLQELEPQLLFWATRVWVAYRKIFSVSGVRAAR